MNKQHGGDPFSGDHIPGDDLSTAEILEWYKSEEEAYAKLSEGYDLSQPYPYHRLNKLHGYSAIPSDFTGIRALSLGGATAVELAPIGDRLTRAVVVDSSESFDVDPSIRRVTQVEYLKATVSGEINAPSGSFDLITCFGTLHHIPNVSTVIGELARVLSPAGYLLLREPVVSMGDWRKPRSGLTPRERGLPKKPLFNALRKSGLQVVRSRPCLFPGSTKRWFGDNLPIQSTLGVWLDFCLSVIFAWNYQYHSTSMLRKVRPRCLFIVARHRP